MGYKKNLLRKTVIQHLFNYHDGMLTMYLLRNCSYITVTSNVRNTIVDPCAITILKIFKHKGSHLNYQDLWRKCLYFFITVCGEGIIYNQRNTLEQVKYLQGIYNNTIQNQLITKVSMLFILCFLHINFHKIIVSDGNLG